tara:strand:- start:449 stop:1162 length:714 start_codon:yes stop_codon:yes gene_type:complete
MTTKKTIGITGATGALGKSLTKIFKLNGYYVIGFTHKKKIKDYYQEGPNKWVSWECGKEYLLEKEFKNIDILILNHGVYPPFEKNLEYENPININSLSNLRIIEMYKKISLKEEKGDYPKEVWINTSEAELLPALNPTYEVSKGLIGQIVTFNKNFLTKSESKKFLIKKIILGPFKSELNPIGIMSPEVVAFFIFYLSKISSFLIIISPNPLTYLIFPIREIYFFIYCTILKIFRKN